MSKEIAIGIDLGTTNSCVAYLKNGVPEVIPNEAGERTTPSMVALCRDGTRLVGKQAKNLQYRNLKNTIYESKRLIGRKYSEDCIQDRMSHWQFKVIRSEDDHPKICVTQLKANKKVKKYFHPEEISGMVLEKMKNIAEEHLGCSVTKAVVTVPAYFNDNQRQATIDAAKIAKLEVLKIINEPTAAAFAYILQNNIHEPCNTLVFDLGGGTFDVSIIHSKSNQFAVVAVNGDPDLGGADFDVLLYNEISSLIQKQATRKITFTDDQTRRIMALCIRVKEQLSDTMTADFDLPNIIDDVDFEFEFKRQDFEKLISHLLKKIMSIVRATLSDAKMSVKDIDNIVLVGGSSRIPAIKRDLQAFFKKDLSFAINPDEAVACGAAFEAAILNEDATPMIRNAAVVDITPFSLGIEAEGKFMNVLIKKNTQLPAFFTKMYTTVLDNQREMRIIVYQGEDELTANNTKLAYFDLTGIPPAPARMPQIWVTFDINTNGVVHVTATEKSSKETVKVQIKTNTGRLSNSDFTKIEEENKAYSKKQKLLNEIASEKDTLLKFCFESKHTVEDSNVDTDDKNVFLGKVNATINYLEALSVSDESDLRNILQKKADLQNEYMNLF